MDGTNICELAGVQAGAQPSLIEVSPVCDLAQEHRVNSLLVGGVIAPSAQVSNLNQVVMLLANCPPTFTCAGRSLTSLHRKSSGYCNRYKAALPAIR